MAITSRHCVCTVGRRDMVKVGLAAGAMLIAARRRTARAQSPITLTLSVWGAQAEQDAFNAVINKYQDSIQT